MRHSVLFGVLCLPIAALELRNGQLRHILAVLCADRLRRREAAQEFFTAAVKRRLRVRAAEAPDLHRGEERIAELLGDVIGVPLRDGCGELLRLLAELIFCCPSARDSGSSSALSPHRRAIRLSVEVSL